MTSFATFKSRPLPKRHNLYHNLGYWFLLLIVLVGAGFYTTYFSVILQPTPPVIHIHFLLMALWIIMLIVQPFLIKYKKLSLHRTLGKVSYVLVPLVLLSTFWVTRFTYFRFRQNLEQQATQGLTQLSQADILREAAAHMSIVFFWLTMFAVFYTLAILNRRKSAVHARYMVATALALLGPTVDRIIIIQFKTTSLPGNLPIELGAFFLANAILVLLLAKDYPQRRPTRTLWISLPIYVVGQVLYFTLPGTYGYTALITFLMQPGF